MSTILQVENLELKIQRTPILNGVSMSVTEGETLGVIGPNGSGKTTLFNSISGFNAPQGGRILFRGQDITRMAPFRRAQMGIGRIFQSSGVFREMTVVENVVTALEGRKPFLTTLLPWGKGMRQTKKEAMNYLQQVGLRTKALAKAGSLSGGQMRLLEMIRTLAYGAELFLLDEPTAGVSPKMKDEVISLIRKLQEMKKTVIVIEHDMSFIQKFCSRIVVLDGGRVALDDTPENVRSSKMLQEIYFGSTGLGPSSGIFARG